MVSRIAKPAIPIARKRRRGDELGLRTSGNQGDQSCQKALHYH